MPATTSCTNEQKILVHVTPQSLAGKPVPIDGNIAVETTVGDGTFTLEADGKSFYAVSGDNPGDTVYVVSADADLGAGVVTISDTVTLTVAGALAANFGITTDSPVLK